MIDEIVDSQLPQSVFCDTTSESILNQINNNLFIKHSPSIVSVIDYATKSYLYVSDNIVTELDITPEELKSVGLGRALMNFEENQRNVFLTKLYPDIFQHYGLYAKINQAKDLHVTYNTLLKTAKGDYQWYFHQLAVLACDDAGFPRYGLKLLSNIHVEKADDVLNFNIYKKNSFGSELIYSRDFLTNEINNTLSERELEIVQLLKKGYSSKQIAVELAISELTVSTHRKNIIRKSKSNSE